MSLSVDRQRREAALVMHHGGQRHLGIAGARHVHALEIGRIALEFGSTSSTTLYWLRCV